MSPETLLLRNDPYKLIRVPCTGKRYNRTHTQTHSCVMRKHTHAKAHSNIFQCESTSIRIMVIYFGAKAHSSESWSYFSAKAH